MPYPLNNVGTLPDYDESTTVRFGYPSGAFSAIVTGGAVFYQIAPYQGISVGPGAEQWLPERFQPPGNLSFKAEIDLQAPNAMFVAIRFRSAVAGAGNTRITVA